MYTTRRAPRDATPISAGNGLTRHVWTLKHNLSIQFQKIGSGKRCSPSTETTPLSQISKPNFIQRVEFHGLHETPLEMGHLRSPDGMQIIKGYTTLWVK